MSARKWEFMDSFAIAERRLNDWGAEVRRASDSLGLPRMSSMDSMIKHVQAEDRKRKDAANELRKEIRKQRRAEKKGGEKVDSKLVAIERRFVEPSETAQGKQTHSFKTVSAGLSSDVLQIDQIVGTLPKWMQQVLSRTYRYLQPFRIGAREMKIDIEDYKSRHVAAVKEVARKLAERGACVVD